ncbi:hypothetical protein EYC95_18535 [Pseudomonas sp. BGI-2]|nr:hypothetical protein EYC95_18535 [Pseudomonas sp. BGI-2]
MWLGGWRISRGLSDSLVAHSDAFASKPAPTLDLRSTGDPMWERACSRRRYIRQQELMFMADA